MSENLHRGEERGKPAARRRWRVYIPAIVALLLLAAGIGVVILEPTRNGSPQRQVRALVAELERRESDDWLSKLLRKYFPDYGEGRCYVEVANAMSALGVEAVPEIITAANHRLPSVRCAAARALGKIGDRRAVRPVADLLVRDSDSDVRNSAVFALGQLSGPEAAARLIEVMADSQPRVRARVAMSLGEVGGSEAKARLIEAMGDPKPDVRREVALALGKVGGPEARSRLIEAMADSDEHVRGRVAWELGKFGGPEATARLIEAMTDSEPTVREAAAATLGHIGDVVATNVLMRALEDKEDNVRVAAARALGHICESQCLPRLIELLKDPAKEVRDTAARALGEMGDPAAVDPLLAAVKDTDGDVRRAAVLALGEIGDSRVTPVLLAAFRDGDHHIRGMAAFSLGLLREPRAIGELIAALNDDDRIVRIHAPFALALQKRPEAVPALAAALRGKDNWSSTSAFDAAVGLALIDTPDAKRALAVGAREAAEPAVRRLAARALAMPLVAAMTEELRGKDSALHLYILYAFAYLRDPASLPAIEEVLNSPDSNIRYAARRAIRHIHRTNQAQAASTPAQN